MLLPSKAKIVAVMLLALTGTPARAEGASEAAAPTCQQAGAAAELRWGIPPGLLLAIGRIESGRRDAATGRVMAWPWSINAGGTDGVFETRAQAIESVLAWQMRGVRSIDIGCFQINLLSHPTAFASIDEGFDATANAEYAARFLTDLHTRSGSWERAVAWYHSATPGVGDVYRDRVLADWSGGGLRILPLPAEGFSAPVGRAAAVAGGVRVWLPSWAERRLTEVAASPAVRASAIVPAAFVRPAQAPAGRLPRVITPHG